MAREIRNERLAAPRGERDGLAVVTGSQPVWTEMFGTGACDPFAPLGAGSAGSGTDQDHRGGEVERGYTNMTRFVRIATALAALATIFLVAGASSKY